MSKKIAGIFDSAINANRAVSELLNSGFKKDSISVIMPEALRDSYFTTDEEANRIAKGTAAGAAFGGTFGAILAGLTAIGTVSVPGVGILFAGPLVAILSGAGAGAAIGGLSGALIRAGFAEDDANKFEQELKAGKAVIIVEAKDDTQANMARAALASTSGSTRAA